MTKGKILTIDPAVTKFVFSEGAKTLFTTTYDRFEFDHIENGNVFVTGKLTAFLIRDSYNINLFKVIALFNTKLRMQQSQLNTFFILSLIHI